MFRFFRNSKRNQIQHVQVDIHAHLIPNLDDGPKSMEESVSLIRGLIELGYETLYATPHVYEEYYPNDRLDVLAGFEALQRTIKRLKYDIKLFPAAEYFLDEHFLKLLEKKELLAISNKYLLVEDAFYERKDLIENYVFQILVNGYRPILAHPERYLHIAKNKDRFTKLKEMGCLFQLNLLSPTGYYGTEVKRLAKYLLKKGYIDFVGTDLHNEPQLKQLRQFKVSNTYRNLLANYNFRNNQIIAAPSLISN